MPDTLDINCDLGEGADNDKDIMPYISSANIACGFHAGDPRLMAETVRLALAHNVAIGAHPGFPDKAGFGRHEVSIPVADIRQQVLYQIGALTAITHAEGGRLHHVKPHGALYNMAARDTTLARCIAQAIADLNPDLILVGLAGSELVKAGSTLGLKVVHEVFADRTYQHNGQLMPRSQPNALIENDEQALAQIHDMVANRCVTTIDGDTIPVQADTLCLHGDGAHALVFAQAAHAFLTQHSITIQPPFCTDRSK
ncbi:5-oxoprolinase subunit PxpA [Kistimonas asteriae]|uniref:5-oxoprolinase subunit PxpA n=1 Tax=Kistimonas asteriae TaxID=517724 RepID=UPI001BA72A3F|nr:5-oxoprolinase subunit PxpA [Kistimonas asteriae]